MNRVVAVNALCGYRLHVVFDDGVEGEVDLSERLFGAMFEPLRKPELFEQAGIDEFGAVCWPNGADLAPDALHETLAAAYRAA
jgi:glycine/D-amino acid oxidase-like deaminating enzyme